jgi:hypothetical protein
MYTNELLEEKYKAQKELYEKSKELSIDYSALVEKEARELFYFTQSFPSFKFEELEVFYLN